MPKTKTIAVSGAGPGTGRSAARRFGQEGFQVALAARNQTRPDAYTGELAADGITAAGFPGDLADRDALPAMTEAITARPGPIDVLEYAPSGLDLLNHATAVRDADAASFEFPLDLLLRTPVTLIRQVLPITCRTRTSHFD
jgi:NAD(P)-dependent dehydrogenase (short-subunit alcohol dehydrogenase family)